jgi:hypothetical protein
VLFNSTQNAQWGKKHASLDKTKEKPIVTDARTTLIYESDMPFDGEEEGKGSRDVTEALMETPGALRARRVQRRPVTPNEDQREEEQLLDVQGTLRILWEEANKQRKYTIETTGS